MSFRKLIYRAVLMLSLQTQAESLFDPVYYKSMVSDSRAYQVGDLLTIQVVESSSAFSTAESINDRSSDFGLQIEASRRRAQGVSMQTNNGFDAHGRVQRTGRLLALITVQVMGRRPNGDLIVSGKQMLDINDEKQEIVLDGVVRPADIKEDNTVQSSRLAEANIRYAGEGELTGRHKPSWWNRFLTWLGW